MFRYFFAYNEQQLSDKTATQGQPELLWKQPGDLRQCREQFWHLEASTSALSLEWILSLAVVLPRIKYRT